MKKTLPLDVSPWAAAVASIAFLLCTRYLDTAYHQSRYCAHVAHHYARHYPELRIPLAAEIDSLASLLGRCSIGKLVALLFAIWAPLGRPRWPG